MARLASQLSLCVLLVLGTCGLARWNFERARCGGPSRLTLAVVARGAIHAGEEISRDDVRFALRWLAPGAVSRDALWFPGQSEPKQIAGVAREDIPSDQPIWSRQVGRTFALQLGDGSRSVPVRTNPVNTRPLRPGMTVAFASTENSRATPSKNCEVGFKLLQTSVDGEAKTASLWIEVPKEHSNCAKELIGNEWRPIVLSTDAIDQADGLR